MPIILYITLILKYVIIPQGPWKIKPLTLTFFGIMPSVSFYDAYISIYHTDFEICNYTPRTLDNQAF